MKRHLILFSVAATVALAAITTGCESSGSDPYGVNSPGYYGSDLDPMNHNLVRPGTTSRNLNTSD